MRRLKPRSPFKEINNVLGSVKDINCKTVGIHASYDELEVEEQFMQWVVVFINCLIGFWLPGGRFRWRSLQQPR